MSYDLDLVAGSAAGWGPVDAAAIVDTLAALPGVEQAAVVLALADRVGGRVEDCQLGTALDARTVGEAVASIAGPFAQPP